jgi:L-threonylcarbamoyladenylate synthase
MRFNHRQIVCAARRLVAGGVVAYPSEYVYGLGCDPRNRQAVARVLHLKRRAGHKGFIVIAASVEQLRGYVVLPEGEAKARVLAGWPGPMTWILPRRAGVPAWLTGGRDTLAVRVTAHPVAQRLCALTGPLLSTSANCSGYSPARSFGAVRRLFGQRLDGIVSGTIQFLGSGTPIHDARTGQVLRG